jgi:hypothetical protein
MTTDYTVRWPGDEPLPIPRRGDDGSIDRTAQRATCARCGSVAIRQTIRAWSPATGWVERDGWQCMRVRALSATGIRCGAFLVVHEKTNEGESQMGQGQHIGEKIRGKIKCDLIAGKGTHTEIARRYEVSSTTVRRIAIDLANAVGEKRDAGSAAPAAPSTPPSPPAQAPAPTVAAVPASTVASVFGPPPPRANVPARIAPLPWLRSAWESLGEMTLGDLEALPLRVRAAVVELRAAYAEEVAER